MITKPTVLILGAGASKPYGFPLGSDLVNNIANLNDDTLKIWGYDTGLIQEFTNAVSEANVTIDRLLADNTKFMDIGKTAIAIIFYQLEKENLLKQRDWYDKLWNAMNDQASIDEFGDNKIAIITYNYEESLEHYLYKSMRSLYASESKDKIISQLLRIKIIHLHGQIGYLPWQLHNNNYDIINPYGGIKFPNYDNEEFQERVDEYHSKIDKISKGIKIIHEDISKNDDYIQALGLLNDAEKIYFLGFGYHPTNLDRLNLLRFQGKGKDIKGSTYQLSSPDMTKIRNGLEGVLELGYNGEDALYFITERVMFE